MRVDVVRRFCCDEVDKSLAIDGWHKVSSVVHRRSYRDRFDHLATRRIGNFREIRALGPEMGNNVAVQRWAVRVPTEQGEFTS